MRLVNTSTRAVAWACKTTNPLQPSKNTGKKPAEKTHSLTLHLQNHLDHFNILLLDTSTICSIRARPRAPDACTIVAHNLTSNKLHDFLQDLWHWHIQDLHAIPWHMLHSHTTCVRTCTEHRVNHMTCPRMSRMHTTNHIPRLTDLKRACHARCATLTRRAFSILLSSHSDDCLLQISTSLAANILVSGQEPLRVGHVFLETLHLNFEVTLPGQFVSIVAVKWQFPPSPK